MRTSIRQPSCPDTRKLAGRSGFTLIELLVVMAIIAIMSGVVLTAISGSDDTQSLDAGISKASGIFSLARSAAITRKAPTRVLVHYDPAEPEKFLRFITVLYQDTSGATPTWKVYADGEFLPNGIFFSPALSSTSSALAPQLRLWGVSIDAATYAVTVGSQPDPIAQSDSALSGGGDPLSGAVVGSKAWYVYEFTAQGTARYPAARAVFVPGIANTVGQPRLNIPNASLAGGFAVFRGGKAMGFQSIQQIQEGN